MNQLNRRIYAIIILCIALSQLIISIARYIEAKTTLSNPLIPVSIVKAVTGFSAMMAGVYLLVVVFNVYYLWKNKFFWAIAVSSALIIVGLGLFGRSLHGYFFRFVK